MMIIRHSGAMQASGRISKFPVRRFAPPGMIRHQASLLSVGGFRTLATSIWCRSILPDLWRFRPRIHPEDQALLFSSLSGLWLEDVRVPQRRWQRTSHGHAHTSAPTAAASGVARFLRVIDRVHGAVHHQRVAAAGGVFRPLVWIFDDKRPEASRPISSTSGPPAVWCSMAIRRWPTTGISRSRFEVAVLGQSYDRLLRLALSTAVPVRRILCWRSFPMRWPISAGLRSASCLISLSYARDRRLQLRPSACGRASRWCSLMRWSGRTVFSRAALIGGALYLIPMRPVLCRHLPGAAELQAAIRACCFRSR